MPDYGDIHALSANATPELHEKIEEACRELGCDKATFIRLAVRLLYIQGWRTGWEGTIRQHIDQQIVFSRSAYDSHKALPPDTWHVP